MEGESKPQKWFDRTGVRTPSLLLNTSLPDVCSAADVAMTSQEQMADAHILGYRVSEDLKWAVVYGIKKARTTHVATVLCVETGFGCCYTLLDVHSAS